MRDPMNQELDDLREKVRKLEAALRWGIQVHADPAGEHADFAWVRSARKLLTTSDGDSSGFGES